MKDSTRLKTSAFLKGMLTQFMRIVSMVCFFFGLVGVIYGFIFWGILSLGAYYFLVFGEYKVWNSAMKDEKEAKDFKRYGN